MAGEQRVLELRQDGVLVAEHPVEQRLAGADPGDGVAPDLLLDRDGLPARLAAADRGWRGATTWRPTYRRDRRVGRRRRPGRRRRVPLWRHATQPWTLSGTWRAAVADDDLRRTWLEPVLRRPRLGADRRCPATGARPPRSPTRDGPLLYRTRFDAPTGRPTASARLARASTALFYQGDVWLDGAYLGDTEGYFFPHDVRGHRARSPARHEHTARRRGRRARRQTDRTAKRNITGVFQHWDCSTPTGTPAASGGRSAIERTGPVRIRRLRVCAARPTRPGAIVVVPSPTSTSTRPATVTLRTIGRRSSSTTSSSSLAAGENQVEWTLAVDHPALWWPHALGRRSRCTTSSSRSSARTTR